MKINDSPEDLSKYSGIKQEHLQIEPKFYSLYKKGLNLEEIVDKLKISLKQGAEILCSFDLPVDIGKNPLSDEFNSKLLNLLFRDKMLQFLVYGDRDGDIVKFINKTNEILSKTDE